MIKIIDITNCRIYNGLFITVDDFKTILKRLTISNFSHTITYYDYKDTKEKTLVV